MTDDEIRAARMRSQRLDVRDRDVHDLVRHVVGIQAQEPRAGALSIRARTEGVTAADVRRALEEERSIVRTWVMRGTIHFVAAEDFRWLTGLFNGRALAGQHRRLDQLGVPEEERAAATATIVEALSAGPLTRAELSAVVTRDGRATGHLARLAALEGHVCFGPLRDGKDTYVLADDWVGPGWQPDDPVRELARRYVAAYGPASAQDMAAWSGLPVSMLKPAFQGATPRVDPPDPPAIRMLPAFDTYLLGYRTRDLAVPPAHAKQVWPGGGIVRPTIVANGLAVGTWRRAGSKIRVEPFAGEIDADDEVTDIERFLASG